ncbi:hypothetical protein HZH68_015538 [Vespula germanica]|uniref:Uncharacterized protein n=1 Tax=Vespula germanica TaxID=30212 RepID=A0A834J8Z2_VESGE|nr:hypothetical protein HZH68_015538 [Vespula germanica]
MNESPFPFVSEDSSEKLSTDLHDNDDSRVSQKRLKKGQEEDEMKLELAGNCFERGTAAGGSTVSRITIAERKRVRETTNVLYNRWKKASLDVIPQRITGKRTLRESLKSLLTLYI